ncbi:MAG: DUF4388 domain-containing protein [Bdellovibrionales bacterium]|nr:DUF4388 domain-containing protein [Bdellovibrionales bacterium]
MAASTPPPRSRKRGPSLDSNKAIKVLCFAQDAVVKGLSWAFEQKVYSQRHYKFYSGSLAQLSPSVVDFDLFVLPLDLGQPVPVENLKKLPPRGGVCALLQPTPQQLLQIAELPDWSTVQWDGAAFEKIATRLDTLAARAAGHRRNAEFVETCWLWLNRQISNPSILEWIDAPADKEALRFVSLDPARKNLTIGCESSSADMRIALPGTNELCELRYVDGHWQLRFFDEKEGLSFSGDPHSVRPGDRIELQSVVLHVRAGRETESFLGLARESGLFSGLELRRPEAGDLTLADLCREFLSSWTTGELRVSSDLKGGSIFFENGRIQHVVSGSVSGQKALLRMLAWKTPTWRFNTDVKSDFPFPDMSLGFSEFSSLHREWKDKWGKVQNLLPPSQLKLRASAKNFLSKDAWTSNEYLVLAAVCEYQLTRDIFNNCSLLDHEILEALVDLRRFNILEPVGPTPANRST